MFDAFSKFANGIFSHESSNQGGGGGRNALYMALQAQAEEGEKEPQLHLAGDSLRLTGPRTPRNAHVDLPPEPTDPPAEPDVQH